MKYQFVILQFATICVYLFKSVLATSCFHCVSPDKHYNATVRRQLATQTDVFFYPIGVKSQYCSASIDLEDPHTIEGQLCSTHPICVTLFPNLQDSSFMVRGCFESILRHKWRSEVQLQQEGCYLLRSLPMFANTVPMDYVVCTCHGDYCNTMPMPDVLPKPYSFGKSRFLKVYMNEERNALQLSTSSASFTFSMLSACSWILVLFHLL